MKRLTYLLIPILAAIYFSSCSPVYYAPNTQNVPLLSHAGEYNVSVTGNNALIELQGSVSPVNHLGIQVNGSFYIPNYNDNKDYGTGYMLDAGVGYYLPFGPQSHFVFETYGIGGVGYAFNRFNYRDSLTPGGSISTNAARFGIQPVFGFKSKYFDAAVSSRFVGLTYFNTTGDLIYQNLRQTDYLNMYQNSFLIEPALTLRAGVDFLKFQFQIQGSFNTNNPHFYQNNSTITLGLILSPNRFENIFSKKDEPAQSNF